MVKPVLTNFQSFAPMLLQKYERYLPTAFDESMSLLQKVNKVIVYLDQMGELTNDLVDQWNSVMEWVLADGISDKVIERLNTMIIDGTMEQLINETVFDGLNSKIDNVTTRLNADEITISNNTNSINGLTTSLSNLSNQVLKIGVDVKTKGAKADYVDDSNRGTDDTTAIQNAINNGGIVFIPDGNYYLAGQLSIKSRTRIIFSPNAKFYTYSDRPFYFAAGVERIRIEGANLYNKKSSSDTYSFYFDGNTSNGYTSSIKNIFLSACYSEGFTWSIYANALRKSTIDSFHGWNRNGFYYTGKSAENVLRDSNFINYDETNMGGSKGFYSVANGDGYPEGLTVANTLFYHYERNIHIKDLYVGKFNELYLDGGIAGSLVNIIEYNSRTQFCTFTDTWALKKGFQLGVDGYSAPKELRIRFNNTIFDACETTGFELKPWIRATEFNNTTFYGTIDANQTAFIARNWNDFLKINGFVGRFLSGFLSVYGNGSFVEANNISNYMNLANNGVYREYAITYNGVTM